MRKIDPSKIRRILVIKWSAMGDVVGATTFIDDICAAFQEAELVFNTLPPWDRLFEGDSRFSRVFAIDVRSRKRRLKAMFHWMHDVWLGRYDLIFDLQSTDRSRAMLGLLRPFSPWTQAIIGHNQGYPYTHAPQRPETPYPGWHSDLALKAIGVPRLARHGRLYVPDNERQAVARLMSEKGLLSRSYVLLLPGSQKAGRLKRWGVDRYAILARNLVDAGVEKVALVGGPDEVEDCASIATLGGPGIVNLNGLTTIRQIVPLAEGAICIVGNDTGAAHVASTAGTPMLVICGPTDPRRVRPIGDHVHAVQWAGECINCYRKTCNYRPGHACMQSIPVDVVTHWVLMQHGALFGSWNPGENLCLY